MDMKEKHCLSLTYTIYLSIILFQIDTQKLTFKESAKPRTNSGVSTGKTRPDSGIECEKTEASV
jgi:hypothetical protein